jgi:hypothetical protein
MLGALVQSEQLFVLKIIMALLSRDEDHPHDTAINDGMGGVRKGVLPPITFLVAALVHQLLCEFHKRTFDFLLADILVFIPRHGDQ